MTEILLKKENILLIILGLFFFLFSVKFTFIPVHSYLIVLLLGILYVTVDYIKNKKTLFVLTVEIRNFIYIFLLLLLWILISYGFNGFEDSYMIKKITALFIKSILCSIIFVYIFLKFKITFKDLLLYLQIIIFVQALFIILYFISADFKQWTLDFIPTSGNLDPRVDFRSRGLMNGASASGALIISFGLLFTAYLVTVSEYRNRLFLYLSISFILILFSIFLVGRTGFLIVPFVGIYFLLLYIYKKEFRKNIKIFIGYIFTYLIIGLISLFILNYFKILSIDLTKFNFPSSDSTKIFEFIDEVRKASSNNALVPFRDFNDIECYLRKQWAGMMYKFLTETSAAQKVQNTLDTLKEMNEKIEFLRGK